MATKKPTTKAIEQAPQTTMASPVERFVKTVERQVISQKPGAAEMTHHERRLAGNSFIAIDQMLKASEVKRISKNNSNRDHKWDNPLPYTWDNVDLEDLAITVAENARLGLDVSIKNHLHPIAYKDNTRNKYVIAMMPGYNGIKVKALKYAVDPPKAVTVELVYSTDTFKALKQNANRPIESYEFDINDPFDRGEIIGGFGYLQYDEPSKNKLVLMSLKDILKRKPNKASGEFWGGTITKWEDGKRVEVESEGWYAEMCLKTLYREIYGEKHIPLDSTKLDDAYQRQIIKEAEVSRSLAFEEIETNAAKVVFDIDAEPDELKQIDQPKVKQISQPKPAATKKQMAMDDMPELDDDDVPLPFDLGADSEAPPF